MSEKPSDDGLFHDRVHVDNGRVRAGKSVRTSDKPTPETNRVTFRILSQLQSGTDEVVYARHARHLERQRDALADALRELTNACEHMRRGYGEDEHANARCTAAQDTARALLAELEAKN